MALSRQGKAWHSTIPYPQKRRGCLGQASRLDTMKDSGRGRWVSTRGAPGASRLRRRRRRGEGRARRRPHRRPRGLPPPPDTARDKDATPPRAPLSRHDTTAGSGAPFPTAAAARGCAARERAPPPRPGRRSGVRGRTDGTGPARLPTGPPPRPRGGQAVPPGVFKPPRRNALGTWRRGGRRSWGEGEAVQAAREDDGGETG